MRKLLLSGLLAASATAALAAPAIDFTAVSSGNTTLGLSNGSSVTVTSWPTFNATQIDSFSYMGVGVSGWVYSGNTSYTQNSGYLWLRNNTADHGLGYCSTNEVCGATNTTGDGDYNELSNNPNNDIVRLALSTGKKWTDIQISSLDTGGTNSNEAGTFYWSSSATPNLNTSTNRINFSHNGLGWSSSTVEGSIFSYLLANGFDVNAPYIFFRAGSWNSSGVNSNGTNNDYVVWGVNVGVPQQQVPEPASCLLVLAGLLAFGLRYPSKAQRISVG